MEQHPVPRNITGFQFRLIGDMTLRQFLYLAGGLGLAFFVYKLPSLPLLFKLPLAAFLGFLGVAFAFLPIQDRPLDKWLLAFIKSITSPTQYVWTKNNPPPEILAVTFFLHPKNQEPAHLSSHLETNEKLKNYLASLQKQPHEVLNAQEKKYIESTLSLFKTYAVYPAFASFPTKTSTSSFSTPLQTQTPSPQKPDFESLQKASPSPSLQTLPKIQPLPSSLPEKNLVLKDLEKLAEEKKRLEEELLRLKKEAEELRKQPTPQIVKPAAPQEKEPTIKTVSPKTAALEAGFTNLPQTPNIVCGVVKDPQKKILPNIILTIKDKNNLPLRALKTNKLGQFAASTPLPNGTYFLEAEDPLKRYVFDIAEITTNGQPFLPIEIIAKGEKELIREKLTKELFGKSSPNL